MKRLIVALVAVVLLAGGLLMPEATARNVSSRDALRVHLDLCSRHPGQPHCPSPSPSESPSPTPVPSDSPSPIPQPTPSPTPSPSPSPSPTPIPTAVPTPTPTPTPSPSSTDPWAVAFGTRPQSARISLSGSACQNIVIANKTFSNLGAGVISISLSGCNGVTIDSVDFETVAEGVFAINSQNITVKNTRYHNIIGPSTRDGGHHGNLVQFDTVTGFLVEHNKGVVGDTEDIVSLYKTNTGRVDDNQFQGTNWSSGSGTGIIVGDGGGGQGIEIDHNTLDCPGQVGIQLINGNPNVHDNVLYCAPRPGLTSPNVGMSTYGGVVSGASVTNNRFYWRKNDGSENPVWWGAGTPATSGNNYHDYTIDPDLIAVVL